MRGTILIVEDDENDRLFESLAFEDIGLGTNVHFVNDGQQAIDYLKSATAGKDRRPLPDLVLLDLMLPKVPGLEVLRWIRSQPSLRSLIVVPLTSSNRLVDVQSTRRAGASDYLTKPLSIDGWRAVAWRIRSTFLQKRKDPQPVWGTLNQTAPAVSRVAAA